MVLLDPITPESELIPTWMIGGIHASELSELRIETSVVEGWRLNVKCETSGPERRR